jgi:type III restriction enzyme
LVHAGFERQEIGDLVVDSTLPFKEPKPTGVRVELVEPIDIALPSPLRDSLPLTVIDAVTWNQEKQILRIEKPLNEEQTVDLAMSIVDETNRNALVQALGMQPQAFVKEKAPAELGEKFEIPVLALKQGDFFHQFEADDLSDYIEWSLSDQDAELTGFTVPDEKRGIKIDITDSEKLKQEFLSAGDAQLELLQLSKEWSDDQLIYWLDRSFAHPELTQAETGLYLSRVIGRLLNGRFDLATLTAHRHRLSKAIEAKIKTLGRIQKRKALDEFLFQNDSPVFVDSAATHLFSPYRYPCMNAYQGLPLPKHFYPVISNLASKGEEYECARTIANTKGIKFWIRNIARDPDASFWIQTSTDKFYPDFVAS